MSNYTIRLIDAGSVGKYYILRKCKLLTSELEQSDRQHAKRKTVWDFRQSFEPWAQNWAQTKPRPGILEESKEK